MKRIEWHGLYAESWGGDLVPEAYAHPAKYSRGLIRQIYAHMLAEGMIAPGDVIGDPFGGQAGGALDAMLNGMHWRGVELEPRFVDLGNQNIELWNGRYAPHFERWGTAALVQGDSRNFAELVGGVACVVSSPPYVDAVNGMGGPIDYSKTKRDGDVTHQRHGMTDHDFAYGSTPGQLGSMPTGSLDAVLTSPPYADAIQNGKSGIDKTKGVDPRDPNSRAVRGIEHLAEGYGHTDGQLGSMKEGSLDAAISSPPYGDTIENGDGPGARWDFATHRNGDKVSSAASYGASDGQLGRLGAVVTSPPWEESNAQQGGKQRNGGKDLAQEGDGYGDTPGNIGNDTGDTFWTASRAIVEQVYLALRPGGYVAFVTGDFVRKGQRVRFGEQWLALCEACGFVPVTWAVAWKTEYNGTQLGMFGDVDKRKDRVSFFRRLANEKNPDAAVLNEDVIFMRKPIEEVMPNTE